VSRKYLSIQVAPHSAPERCQCIKGKITVSVQIFRHTGYSGDLANLKIRSNFVDTIRDKVLRRSLDANLWIEPR
jgi:hypothetical protein